jgi:hypothetical protein
MEFTSLLQNCKLALSTMLADLKLPSPSLLSACKGGNSHSING